VAANTVVYPEQCGQLGLCYVRTSNGVPTYDLPVRRFARLVGPIAGELTGGDAENTDWTLGQSVPTNWLESNTGGAFSGYHALFSLGSTPDAGTSTRWTLRMKPLRYRVESPVGPQFGLNYRVRYNRRRETSWYMSYTDEVQQQFGDVGLSSRTIKSTSWLHPMTINAMQLPCAGIVSPSMLTGRFTEEKAGTLNRTYRVATYIWRARIWIDGVDRTGIVPLSSAVTLLQPSVSNGNLAFGGVPYCGPPSGAISFTPAALVNKTIEFDLWPHIQVEHTGAAPGAGDFWGTPTRPVCWAIADCRGMAADLYSASIYSTLPTAKRWEFAFSSNGPGGVSTIRNEPTAGWTYSETTGGFSLVQSAGSGYLSMNYLREIPLIEVRNGYYLSGLYVPDDDAEFDNLTFSNGQQWKPGMWNANAATTYRLIGTREDYYGVPYLWLRALDTSSGWSNLPETITVTPV
jgi:hypothetical protein